MNTELQSDQDDWMIDDDASDQPLLADARPWRVLIVDDEADVHAVTRLVLSGVVFKNRSVELLSAYSGNEGFEVLAKVPDIALVLLDVVMETDDAGLQLVRRIRDELNNHLVRIVLRTGQPGQAPEERVIVDYDINDYKAKTELTKQKIFTTVISSLRAYEGLVTIERSRIGLSNILNSTSNLYELRSLQEFASGVLNQVNALLDLGAQGAMCVLHDPRQYGEQGPAVLAATGQYSDLVEQKFLPADHPYFDLVSQVLKEKKNLHLFAVSALFIHADLGGNMVIILKPNCPLAELQCSLLSVFCDRIGAAFENLQMFGQLQCAQEATVVSLADLAESRDSDTGGHIQRVAKLTDAIARRLHADGKYADEFTPRFLSCVGLASMLHDIGKVSTPDAVLLKPGKHTPEERRIMEQHVQVGEAVLRRAARSVAGVSHLTFGAEIAGGHHEHFDGQGYPRQSKGVEIPLSARIVAVVDVFDALLHRRPYKEPWPLSEVSDYLKARKSTQFDPEVVDALLSFVESEKPDWLVGSGH
jgi:response regulator RpfG family c-di-GMP phosphodiesterase